MKKTIQIDNQTVEMASNAFTPILFRQIFKKDFIREVTSLRKLKGKTASNMTDEEIGEASNKTELFTMLAFTMAKQAELKTPDKLMNLSQMDFYSWLSGFEAGSFSKAETMAEIISLWKGNSGDKAIESKNSDGREQENLPQP